MKRALLATALLLSACATDSGPPPAVQIRTVERVVEVQRPCPVKVPVRPGPLAKPLPTDAIALAAVLALKLNEYIGPGKWADGVESALDKCTKP